MFGGELRAQLALASASPASPVLHGSPRSGLRGGRRASLSFHFLKPPNLTPGDYSSHHAVRQQEEGALRADKKNKEKKKKGLPASRGESARQVSDR